MKKNEIKGLSAFEMLDGLDDDMILSASLPEAVPASVPTAGERIAAFFARMGRGGMAAAIVAVVVVLGVLGGVLVTNLTGSDDPTVTQPSHGVQGTSAPQATDAPDTGESPTEDGSGSVVLPPLTESPDNTQKSGVSVVSDGITVYPNGYCVYISEQRRNEKGELEGLDGDGFGAVYQLAEIWDELPTLRTAGNSYALNLPKDNMSLRGVRIFETVNGIEGIFEEFALPAGAESAADVLKSVTSRKGEYVVVLEVYHETIYSADEYTKGVDEYAFRLTVDPNMDTAYPLRLLVDGKTYYLQGSDGINSGHALTELAPSIPTATITRDVTTWDFYLAPVGTLQSVTAYDGSFRLMMTEPDIEPLVSLSAWKAGDYYFVFTATFSHEGESLTLEYPIHIRLVEEPEEESTPAGDVGETPEPPRIQIRTGFGDLYFGSKRHSSEYHEGYMLWVEEWHDGGMLSGDGLGATGQLAEIAAELPALLHYEGETPTIRVTDGNDYLPRIYIYRNDLSFYADTRDASTFSTLPEGDYIIVLRVETQGDYIPEAEAYERTCTEYAFVLKVVEEHAGIPGVPETNPRVTVSGGGQTAVFETEEDGFLAWREVDLSHVEGIRAADVIFTDDDAMRALPTMEIVYGDTLTLTLDAAGDDLIMVYLYDAKGGFVTSGADLSVVNKLQNEGWDQHVIVILQIHSLISN
ncbi:MAG: hypothetical protein IKU90_01065, partial [Clostridia bacterium]|nr:hypothetical protein [Clostridia bacterium]